MNGASMIANTSTVVTVPTGDGDITVNVKTGHRYNPNHPAGAWMAEHRPELFDLGSGDPADEAGETPNSNHHSEE